MENKLFYLMRKDNPVTLLSLNINGELIWDSEDSFDKEQAPVCSRSDREWFGRWWKERSIPLSREHVHEMLAGRGYSLPSEFLVKNLGLSLTDYYWIRPVDSSLSWKDVNLYDNDFTDNTLHWDNEDINNGIPHYSPNSTLLGDIEKSWSINDGIRYLVKGNRTSKSDESINEVIATHIHELQGFTHADYILVKIKGKSYDYGCSCPIFTSQQMELISAYELILSEERRSNVSYFEHLKNVCAHNGMEEEEYQKYFDYLLMTDYIMSQNDRHFNNIAFIRDADTLKLTTGSPIYDSGSSFFRSGPTPAGPDDFIGQMVRGFETEEIETLKWVQDPSAVNLNKLPEVSYIRDMYAYDSKTDERHLDGICYAYEKKIEYCGLLQQGLDYKELRSHINSERYPIHKKEAGAKELIVMCGLPFSGKTNKAENVYRHNSKGMNEIPAARLFPVMEKENLMYASMETAMLREAEKQSKNLDSITLISSTKIREELRAGGLPQSKENVRAISLSRIKIALATGCSVVYDAMNITADEREELIRQTAPFNVGNRKLIVMDTPENIIIERSKKADIILTKDDIERMSAELYSAFPLNREGWDKIEMVHFSKEKHKQMDVAVH